MIEPPQSPTLTIHGYSLTSVSTPLIIFVALLASPQLHMELLEDGVVIGPSVVETLAPAATTAHLKPRPHPQLYDQGLGQRTIFIVDSLENAEDTS